MARAYDRDRDREPARLRMMKSRRARGVRPIAEANAAKSKGTERGYLAAHHRANKVLPRECSTPDDTCRGRLELALRHDAPDELVREYTGPVERFRGRMYYVGDDAVEGYMRLCGSHHQRYDRESKGLPPGRRRS